MRSSTALFPQARRATRQREGEKKKAPKKKIALTLSSHNEQSEQRARSRTHDARASAHCAALLRKQRTVASTSCALFSPLVRKLASCSPSHARKNSAVHCC